MKSWPPIQAVLALILEMVGGGMVRGRVIVPAERGVCRLISSGVYGALILGTAIEREEKGRLPYRSAKRTVAATLGERDTHTFWATLRPQQSGRMHHGIG
jgi:hypothetical protein